MGPLSLVRHYVRYIDFVRQYLHKRRQLADGRFSCTWRDRWACLDDVTATTDFDAQYVYHTAWAARILARLKPEKHTDIGSCLRFATLVSAFVPVEFYDYRPARIGLSGLYPRHADIRSLPFVDSSVTSLSCMHVVEHIGLERYGDPFDPKGDLTAIAELQRVLAGGGNLLFAAPVGERSIIQYNGHRIYSYADIVSLFPRCSLAGFAYINGEGAYIENASERDVAGTRYGCGCFHWVKK